MCHLTQIFLYHVHVYNTELAWLWQGFIMSVLLIIVHRSEEPALTNMDISTGHMVLVSCITLHHHMLTRAWHFLYLAHPSFVFWHLTCCPKPQEWDALWTETQISNCQIVDSSSCPVFQDMKTSRVKWEVWKLCCCDAVWFGNEVPTFCRYLVPQSSCHLRWLWY
jgi:hypothetical protein